MPSRLDPAIGTEADYGIENLEWTPRVIFSDNIVRNNRDYPAFHWNRHRILLERVAAFTMEGNKFEGGFDPGKDLKQVPFD